MKTCSGCNTQYEDSEEKCPNCGLEAKESGAKKEDWVILTTVANDIEFGMVAGLLEMANIPAVREVKGIDGFLEVMLGVPLGGIIVRVPPDKYEEALQLLNAPVEDEELAKEEAETEEK